MGIRLESFSEDTQSISPIPFVTPNPTVESGAQDTPIPEATQTPEEAGTPQPESTQDITLTPMVALSPAPEVQQVNFGFSTFAIGALVGAALVAALALAIRAGVKRRAKAKKTAGMRGFAMPQGLEIGNAHNIGKRSNQEDSFGISDLNNQRLVSESGILAVVADGMGGLADGELVSAAAVGAMIREFPTLSKHWMPQQKLLYLTQRACDAANAVTGGARNQGGSTLLATLVRDGKLWFVSVGDSRICLVRGGCMLTLTRPHVYETDLDRRAARGELTFEDAIAESQRAALTSYIGMGELENIDFNPRGIQLLAGDWVLLMTDGVFNALDEEEIAAALYGAAQHAAERIESRVIAKGLQQQDNLTVVALRIV